MYKILSILSMLLLFQSCDDNGTGPHQCLEEVGDVDNDGVCDDVDTCIGEYDCAGICEGSSICFNTDVSPIFHQNCVTCHGNAGNLYLGTYASTMSTGDSGNPAVVPGDLNQSEIWNRIFTIGDMPPSNESPLSNDEIQTIQLWIEQGANE